MVNIPSPYKEELHTALCAVKAEERVGNVGICRCVRIELYDVFTYEGDIESAMWYLTEAILAWPKRFNDRAYPVGGYDEYIDEDKAGTIWQNPRRLELLDYLIEQTA